MPLLIFLFLAICSFLRVRMTDTVGGSRDRVHPKMTPDTFFFSLNRRVEIFPNRPTAQRGGRFAAALMFGILFF